MKKLLTIILAFVLILTLAGCEKPIVSPVDPTNPTDPIDPDNPTDPIDDPEPSYTIDDFYDELAMYSERLDNIIQEGSEQIEVYSPEVSRLSGEYDEWLTTITREEMLEAYNGSTHNIVNEDYYEQLITTQMFVDTIKSIINEDEIELNQDYFSGTVDDVEYKFLKTSDDYLLIDALIGSSHRLLKMGLNNDLLDYQEFEYYFNLGEEIDEEISMNFHYFKFLEDKEAIVTRYSPQSSSLRVTNIESNEQFQITVGEGIIEGPSEEESGYVLNRYDSETNSRAYLQVSNNEIISETYDVFDEHGSVFRYQDNPDVFGDIIRLQINFVTATGWDYVVASDGSSPEIDALTGIFTEDGTKIYDEWFNYTYTPTYGHLGLWIELDSRDDLTDEVFSLNQFGMNLEHEKASVEYFESIDLNSFNDVRDTFILDDLNFFSEDLQNELYMFIDEDIRNAFEGKTNAIENPNETTGDVEDFEDAFEQYFNNLEAMGYYISNGLTTTTYTNSSDVVLLTETVTDFTYFNVNDLFFSYSSLTAGVSYDTYGYYIDGTTNYLLELERFGANSIMPTVLSETANEEDFLAAVESFLSGDDSSNATSIEAIDEYTFNVTIEGQYLSKNGFSLDILMEQQGISGLKDQTIVTTYAFNEDYTSYATTLTIEGLSYTDGEETMDITIDSDMITSIEMPDYIVYPLENPAFYFYLPTTPIEDFLVRELGNERTPLREGTQYLTIDVPIGEYSIELNPDYYYTTQFTIYDKDMKILVYENNRFEATYDGIYYVEIYSSIRQSSTINIQSNPTPIFIDIAFEATDGEYTGHFDNEGNSWYTITVPTADYDRLIKLEPYYIGEYEDPMLHINYQIEDLFIDGFCMFEMMPEYQDDCYFYLPANYDITFDLDGYFIGDFGINYSYIEIPQGEFDNSQVWEDIYTPITAWLTVDEPQSRVDFTITESGTYSLDTIYRDFGYTYQDAVLFSSDGNEIVYDWDFPVDLEPGDYYIMFVIDYFEDILVYIEAVIVKE